MDINSKNIIISQPYGGLGDNLQYSTLPKLFKELGYNVYISNTNTYRNIEIYKLIWELNPYISGISDLPTNAGFCKNVDFISNNPIKNIELSHGIKNGTQKYPVIYYKPKLIPELSNVLLFDTTNVAVNYSDNYIYNNFNGAFEDALVKYPDITIKQIIFKNYNNRIINNLIKDIYIVNSIFDLCDVIYSCKVFICLQSGAQNLASAIKQGDRSTPEVNCFHNYNNVRLGTIHWYDNINYIYSPT